MSPDHGVSDASAGNRLSVADERADNGYAEPGAPAPSGQQLGCAATQSAEPPVAAGEDFDQGRGAGQQLLDEGFCICGGQNRRKRQHEAAVKTKALEQQEPVLIRGQQPWSRGGMENFKRMAVKSQNPGFAMKPACASNGLCEDLLVPCVDTIEEPRRQDDRPSYPLEQGEVASALHPRINLSISSL
jgi:hypothetical protein